MAYQNLHGKITKVWDLEDPPPPPRCKKSQIIPIEKRGLPYWLKGMGDNGHWAGSQRDLVSNLTFFSNHAFAISAVISLLNGHHWLNFWTSFTKYDIFGKVTQKFMGKWLKKLWGNATKSWGNDARLWGNDAKLWGNDSKTMGKWLNIMGKWSKILWGIASTAKWLHPIQI